MSFVHNEVSSIGVDSESIQGSAVTSSFFIILVIRVVSVMIFLVFFTMDGSVL